MIKQDIYIKPYNWKVEIIYNADIANIEYIIEHLRNICKDINLIRQAKEHILRNDINSGFIYSSYDKHKSLILIGKTDSKEQLVNTVAHEAAHLQSHIADYYNLDRNGEDVCYLIAAIIQNIYNFITENI